MFTFDEQSFLLNGKRFFLYSGEIHYFRLKKECWEGHLKKLKMANLNTVSTYIPWGWHEYEEGKFDFNGKTCPERDLEHFIRLCRKYGLYLSVKPGPYMLGEYVNQGLPEWLTGTYPQIIAVRSDGTRFPSYVVSYMHPVFIQKTLTWYDHVLPVLKKYQISQEGTIILFQVCNEVGVDLWLFGEGDYSPTAKEYYQRYLTETYQDIGKLNRRYKKNYPGFSAIKELPHGKGMTLEDFLHYQDWHNFHRWYYALYLDFLIQEIKKRGITILLYHNVPGWVYGRATDFPLNITMYSELVKKHPGLVLGVDHIPENVSFRNFHDDFICNGMVSSMQQKKNPVFVAELQAGSREHSVRTYPNEMELFYKACLAHDIKGMNLYMFSQGQNPEHKGAFGPTFYWETVVDVKGKCNELYEPVKRLGLWIQGNEPSLLESVRKSDIAVGWYKPYYHTEFIYPFPKRETLMDFARADLNYDPKGTMNGIYFDGVLKVLKMLNYDYDITDLETVDKDVLQAYKQLWVVSLDYMDIKTQQKLLAYVQEGGTLIISPTLPDKDSGLEKCTVLREGLHVVQKGTLSVNEPKCDVYNHHDICCSPRINLYASQTKKEAIALINKMCCGLEKRAGKGKAVILGFGIGYNIKEHLAVYETLVQRSKIEKTIISDNPYITLLGRYTGRDSLLLFVLNYHRTLNKVNITVKLHNQKITLPTLSLDPTSALILPMNMAIPQTNCIIKYTTSEILSYSGNASRLSFQVLGKKNEETKIVIDAPKRPKSVLIAGEKAPFIYKQKTIKITMQPKRTPEQVKIIF